MHVLAHERRRPLDELLGPEPGVPGDELARELVLEQLLQDGHPAGVVDHGAVRSPQVPQRRLDAEPGPPLDAEGDARQGSSQP